MFIEIIVIALLCFILVELRTLNKENVRLARTVLQKAEGHELRITSFVDTFKKAFDPKSVEYKFEERMWSPVVVEKNTENWVNQTTSGHVHYGYQKKVTQCLNEFAKDGWQVISVNCNPDSLNKNGSVLRACFHLKRWKAPTTEIPGVFNFGSSNSTPGGGFTFGKT